MRRQPLHGDAGRDCAARRDRICSPCGRRAVAELRVAQVERLADVENRLRRAEVWNLAGNGMIASSCADIPASPPYGLPSESRGPSVPSSKPRTVSLPPVKMCRCGGTAVVSPNALDQPRLVVTDNGILSNHSAARDSEELLRTEVRGHIGHIVDRRRDREAHAMRTAARRKQRAIAAVVDPAAGDLDRIENGAEDRGRDPTRRK